MDFFLTPLVSVPITFWLYFLTFNKVVTLLQTRKRLCSFGPGEKSFLWRLWTHSWHRTSQNIGLTTPEFKKVKSIFKNNMLFGKITDQTIWKILSWISQPSLSVSFLRRKSYFVIHLWAIKSIDFISTKKN